MLETADKPVSLDSPSLIENVDFAFFDWLDKELNLFCNTKDGLKKVPVLWVSPERAFQIKSNREFRDLNGALIPPFITVERTNISKDQKESGIYYANIPPKNDKYIVSRRINQKKTSEFQNATALRDGDGVNFIRPKNKNKKIVYEYKEILLPVYSSLTYNIEILTQYQQQMNEILQPFVTKTGSTKYFLIERDGYKYECFIDGQFQSKNTLANMENEERRYISTLSIKVLANLLSDGLNENRKIIKTYENAVELMLNREKIEILSPDAPMPTSDKITAVGGNSSIINTQKILQNEDFNATVGPHNTSDGITVITHNLNNSNLVVGIRERDTLINIVTNIYYYDNYIEIDGLEEGIEYLFTITG